MVDESDVWIIEVLTKSNKALTTHSMIAESKAYGVEFTTIKPSLKRLHESGVIERLEWDVAFAWRIARDGGPCCRQKQSMTATCDEPPVDPGWPHANMGGEVVRKELAVYIEGL